MTLSSESTGDTFNKEKFRQVLHYIISKTGNLTNVGKKVIFKLLYFNDFNYYELKELKMTGEIYYKYEHGPVPKDFNSVIEEMKKDKLVDEKTADYYNHNQIRYISLKEPSLSLLSADEIKHIDDTLGRYASMNGSQIEAVSHKDMPWIASDNHGSIDYDLVFYRSADMSVREYIGDDGYSDDS